MHLQVILSFLTLYNQILVQKCILLKVGSTQYDYVQKWVEKTNSIKASASINCLDKKKKYI